MLAPLAGKRILITGANGSLGSAMYDALLWSDVEAFFATDIRDMDVTELGSVLPFFTSAKPDIIFHLAGAKHAPQGELEPYETMVTNVLGTQNILFAAEETNARVVLASTCKAINPETAYGASKLIAERMVLNYENGAVARFHNVVETQGNVFDYWENDWAGSATSHYGHYPVTDCWRYFLFKEEAIALLLYAATAERGLYSFYGGEEQSLDAVAARLYGRENTYLIPRRRGDRGREPFAHEDEAAVLFDGPIRKLAGPHAGS